MHSIVWYDSLFNQSLIDEHLEWLQLLIIKSNLFNKYPFIFYYFIIHLLYYFMPSYDCFLI